MAGETSYLRAFVQAAFRCALAGAALFLPSGRADWPAGWAYVCACAGWSFANILLLGRLRPELFSLREAAAPRPVEPWDKFFVEAVPVLIGLELLACGVDGPSAAFSVQAAAAFAVILAAFALFSWALLSNPFAAGVVALLPGQRPADGGPYRAVRHPIYLASAVVALCTPAALGSAGGFAPAGLVAAALAGRTALEDRLLLRALPGYREYAARVPYRLLPGIW